MNNTKNYNSDKKIIVDRNYIEGELTRELLWYVIPSVFCILIVCFLCGRTLFKQDTPVLNYIGFIIILLGVGIPAFFLIRSKALPLRAVRKGDFHIVEDIVSEKSIDRTATDTLAFYNIKGTVSAAYRIPAVNAFQNKKIQINDTIWLGTVKTKKMPLLFDVYPDSSYCISDELTPFLVRLPASLKDNPTQENTTVKR